MWEDTNELQEIFGLSKVAGYDIVILNYININQYNYIN